MSTENHDMTLSRRRRLGPPWAWLLTLALLAALFAGWPELDLQVSTWAAHADGGGRFAWGDAWPVQAAYQLVPWLTRLALLLGLLLWFWPRWRRRGEPGWVRWRLRARPLLWLLVVGVWLVVNAGFKEHWGRPRPVQVQAFGGEHPFRSVAQPSELCRSNCAFVSGHAAAGYALMGVGLLAPRRRRLAWARAGLVAGLLLGLGRVLQGGHFASDVLFAGLIVWGVAQVVRHGLLRARLRRWRRQPLKPATRRWLTA
jgi:membrane-associated PAP2 superfamily phosphatase